MFYIATLKQYKPSLSDSERETKEMSKLTTKHLGDAGEYYALSQFIFWGLAATKMPDNWPSYDLVVDLNDDLKKVSVKTRITSKDNFSTEHFKFSKNDTFDFLVGIFKARENIWSWVLPRDVAMELGKVANGSDINYRRISFKQLNEFGLYQNNWELESKENA